MKTLKSGMCVLGVLLFAVSTAHGTLDDPSMEARTKVGERMPPISVDTLEGKPFAVAANRGKVIVVNFWATWCGPCKIEMPVLQKDVWERFRGDPGFAMVAIAREQDRATVAELQQTHKEYSFPLAFDPQRTTYKLFADAGIPRSYVVNRKGVIVFQSLGGSPSDLQELERVVEKSLHEK